jgi:hypothetical protein
VDNQKHGTETWYKYDGEIEKTIEFDQGEQVVTENQ